MFANVANDNDFSDAEKNAIVKYTLSYMAKSGMDKARNERIQQAQQQAVELINENLNPSTNSVMVVKVAGRENPVKVASGNIIPNESGEGIDIEKSENKIYIEVDGKTQVVSPNMIESVVENTPADQATARASELMTAPIIAQHENDLVEQHNIGDNVRVNMPSGEPLFGQITGMNQDGTYLFSVETPVGTQQINIEPRQIMDTNIKGMSNGSVVRYRNESGQEVTGEIENMTDPNLRLQGLIEIDGNVVPVSNVIGLAQAETKFTQQLLGTGMSEEQIQANLNELNRAIDTGRLDETQLQDAISLRDQYNDELTKRQKTPSHAPEETNKTAENIPKNEVIQPTEQNNLPNPTNEIIARAPKQQSGEVDYDALLEQNPEDFAALYESEEGAEETQNELQAVSNNIQSKIDAEQKKLDNADSINARKASRNIIKGLSERKARIDGIIQNRYTQQEQKKISEESLTLPTRKTGQTAAVSTPMKSASKDINKKPVKQEKIEKIKQNKRENKQVNKETKTERQSFIDNTPPNNLYEAALLHLMGDGQFSRKDYKHHGGTDIPIRMNSKLTSKGDRFDSFEQDYYSKHRPSEFNSGFESNLEPIKEAIEDFEKSRGKFDELKKLFGKETKDPLANMTEQEAKKYEEYEKAYKEEKKQIEQQESTPVEEELTPTQQQFINEQISEYDKLITDAEKSHRQAIKDRDNAMSEFNQANNLFREETEERNLFGNEGMTDVSNENARRINEQYQSAVDRAKTELDNLRNNRNSAIENIIREAKAQTEIPEPEKSIQKQLNDVGGDIIAHANNVVKKAEVRKEEGNVNTNPSEVQKEAGNYQKGHVNVQGFDITIENPKGSIRSGIDENGNQWSQKMNNTYGYIRGTKGKDGDHIDVFLGDNLTSDKVFVIDRVNPETGAFDEHKVMLGFNSTEEARKAYVSNYGDGSAGLGRITETNIANFRKWTENEGRRIKPFAEYKDNQPDVPELDDNFFTTEETAPFQITDQQFTPISKEAFGRLINRLKESGLARNVITDEKKMREYLGKKGVRAFQALADLSNAHSVSKFINDVLDGKIKKGEQLITIPYRINKIAEKKIGHQITSHKVRAEEIRHIKNEHGRARTEYPNDIPLRNEDIALLPYIMAAPDNILKGTTKGGRESVRYEKTLSNGNIIIVESEIRPKGTDMQNITMWAKKNHSTNAPSATLRASGATSETHISQNDVAKIMQDYEIAKQKEENNLRNDIRLMSTYKGEIYGFVTPEGDVYIDPTKLNANTPIHEFGHLFWNSSIPEEMKTEITNLLKQTPGWKKLENNPAYSNLKTDDQKADELFNTLLGNYGENNLQTREIMGDNISLFARIQNAINNFLQWLKAKFGNTTARLNEFAKQTLGNLLSGEELSPSQSQEGDTKNQSVNLENSKETNNFAENVEDNVRYNTEQILQSDSRMEYERISGRERNAEVAGRLESYRQTDRRNVSGTQSSKSKQEDELKKYAKQEGIWLDEKDIKANAERKIPSGKEADVYINKDGKTVTKVINYSKYSKTPAEFLDNRILLFNQLFDGTPYKIVGFTETNKGFSFVVEQPFIKGRLLDNLATSVDSLKTQQKRVEDYMLEKFGMEPSGVDAYSNGEITIEDVHLKNVIEGEDGNLYVIDAVPHFNESENEQNTEIKQPDSNVRFQIAPTTPTTQQYREELDKKLNRWQSKFAENWQDRYLPVKEFLDVLRKAGTDIKDYADFYLQSTHLAGKNDAQWESYNRQHQQPLNETIHKLTQKGFELRDIENYAILKHGLERNAFMSQKDISEGKTPRADYSGVQSVEKEIGKSAADYISEFESQAGNTLTNDFWKKINDATNFSIKKQMESGLISKQTYDDLTNRYKYYIPLRGHDKITAEDIWDYSPNNGTFFSDPLIKTNGRISRSEVPFAYIPKMAQSAIISGNRNMLNQTLKRLAAVDKTGLISVNRTWFDVNTGEALEPTYSENPDQYRQNIEDFENNMQAKQQQGLVTQNRSSLDIGGMFIKPSQKTQHAIQVYQNGKPYSVYINGNPAVSRAINGQNVELPHSTVQYVSNVTRFMAANFTTRNPAFVLSNMSRDYLFSSSILAVKEDIGYALKFQGNIFSGKSGGTLLRYLQGRMDLRRTEDRYLSEYIMNGAKTGFSHIVELRNIQKRVERDIKSGNKRNIGDGFLDAISSCNDFAENLCRFSVYMTSRNDGRSVAKSISDAKEVTVNFNRRGAGGMGASFFTPLYLFSNAAIQALANFSKVAWAHKGKAAIMMAAYMSTGFFMPLLSALIGGDDGEDEYMKIPDWDRQNNLCIYTGSGFIKIPLPQELRVFHRMGDNIYQTVHGYKDADISVKESILGMLDLVPINPVGNVEQGSWAEAFPDFMRPFMQILSNKTFSGRQIANEFQEIGASANKPGYTKVKTNKRGDTYAPEWMIDFLKWTNSATGGDEHKAGWIGNLKWGKLDLTNPDKLNHILNGYFGGLYDLGIKTATTADKIYEFSKTGNLEIKTREIPIANRFWTSTDDTFTSNSGLQSRFYKAKNAFDEDERLLKAYKEDLNKGKINQSEFNEKTKNIGKNSKIMDEYKKDFLNSKISIDEYNNKKNEIDLESKFKKIENYEKNLKNMDKDQQRESEREISRLKQEAIDIFNEGD